jgi:hypothetical protein
MTCCFDSNKQQIMPNGLVQPGPTHVVPLLTARLTKALSNPLNTGLSATEIPT